MSSILFLAFFGGVALVSLVGLAMLMLTGGEAAANAGAGDGVVPEEGDAARGGSPIVRTPDGAARVLSDEEARRQALEARLVQAGIYRKGSTGQFVAARIMMALAPLGIALLCVQFEWLTPIQALLMAAITAIIGIVAPGLWLDYRKGTRQTAIRRALPDALDIIVVCVEAGLSLSAAMVRVGRELRGAHPMLASEITIVYREVQLGNTTGIALQHFANRFDMEELRSLSSVVRQAEKFGASIASALRVHAETLRLKRLQAAQERAQKAAVKLLFPTVLCIFPALFVVILGPAAFDIMKIMSEHAQK